MTRRFGYLIVLVLAAALVATGCGDDAVTKAKEDPPVTAVAVQEAVLAVRTGIETCAASNVSGDYKGCLELDKLDVSAPDDDRVKVTLESDDGVSSFVITGTGGDYKFELAGDDTGNVEKTCEPDADDGQGCSNGTF